MSLFSALVLKGCPPHPKETPESCQHPKSGNILVHRQYFRPKEILTRRVLYILSKIKCGFWLLCVLACSKYGFARLPVVKTAGQFCPLITRRGGKLRKNDAFGLTAQCLFLWAWWTAGRQHYESAMTEASGPCSSCVKPLPIKFRSTLTTTPFGASSADTQLKHILHGVQGSKHFSW